MGAEVGIGIYIWLVLLAIYFLPTIIAMVRNHTNKLAIIIVNVALGWTGIGWLGALIWAVINPSKK